MALGERGNARRSNHGEHAGHPAGQSTITTASTIGEARPCLVDSLTRAGQQRLRLGHTWISTKRWLSTQLTGDGLGIVIHRLQQPALADLLDDHWQFARRLRRGDFADVWMVRSREADQSSLAVVKILREYRPGQVVLDEGLTFEWSADEARRRFQRETRILTSLAETSSCACQLRTSGVWRDTPYFVMDWIDGEPLPAYCRTHCLTPYKRVDIFLEVVRSVRQLHTAAIAHRDLKPRHVLVATDGNGNPVPRIIDFGAAMRCMSECTETTDQLTATTSYMHTALGPYLTPEQGQAASISLDWAKADVYRMGLMLHELLYGFRPWQHFEPVGTGECQGRLPFATTCATWATHATQIAAPLPLPAEQPLIGSNREQLAMACGLDVGQYEALLRDQELWQCLCRPLEPDPGRRCSAHELEHAIERLLSDDLFYRPSRQPGSQVLASCIKPRRNPSTAIAVLIATRNRSDFLLGRSLPSILRQTLPPRLVVVVNDGDSWDSSAVRAIHQHLSPLEVVCTFNDRVPGAGGAWNTGLALLHLRGDIRFVAMLDDDDSWDETHLRLNFDSTLAHQANICVTGLRMRSASGVVQRPFIEHLDDRSFLCGNPGWQGSNTFVDLDLLLAVGGFRESLSSCHDRDLAIRLLRHPAARPHVVDQWTATWHTDHSGRLSDRLSDTKLDGLRTFWRLYRNEMSTAERHRFFERAHSHFGFSSEEVRESPAPDLEQPSRTVGDLHV